MGKWGCSPSFSALASARVRRHAVHGGPPANATVNACQQRTYICSYEKVFKIKKYIHVHMYICTHSCRRIHMYVHTYRLAYMHTYIRKYIHASQLCMLTISWMHAYMHAAIHIHTYRCVYIYIRIQIHVQTRRNSKIHT